MKKSNTFRAIATTSLLLLGFAWIEMTAAQSLVVTFYLKDQMPLTHYYKSYSVSSYNGQGQFVGQLVVHRFNETRQQQLNGNILVPDFAGWLELKGCSTAQSTPASCTLLLTSRIQYGRYPSVYVARYWNGWHYSIKW